MDRTYGDLGPTQQRFLHIAYWEGVPLDDPICTPRRLMALEGLIVQRTSKKGRVSWRTTPEGTRLYRTPAPVFLHKRGFPSYTRHAWQAVFGEPEVMAA